MLNIFRLVPGTVKNIGIISCLVNLSGLIAFSLYGPYMSYILQIPPGQFGMIEGIVEFIAWGSRIVFGTLSDLFARRKIFLLIALVLIVSSRLMVAYSAMLVLLFVVGRIMDRLGNGIQASPREAMVGDHTTKQNRAACYGVRQGMGYAGSVIGALILMFGLETSLETSDDYKNVFLFAAIPTLIALLIIIFAIRDKNQKQQRKQLKAKNIFSIALIKELGPKYWSVLLFVGIYFFSTYSGTFLNLYAKDHGGSIGMNMLMQNFTVMVSSLWTAKRLNHFNSIQIVRIGIMALIAANILLIIGGNMGLWYIYLAMICYGAYMGITFASVSYLIADFTVEHLRGSAFGIYYLLSGVILLISNSVYGYICEHASYFHMFALSLFISIIAFIILPIIVKIEDE